MKLIKIIVLLVGFFSNHFLFAQLNWGPIKPNQYEMSFIWKDTSLVGLRNTILDNNSDPIKYLAAAKYLASYHKGAEQQFLLDNLNTQIDSTNTPDKIYWNWSKFYTDKLIRGYLGDSNAIAGMDTIFRNQQPFNNFKGLAVRNLAQIEVFSREYFDYAKNEFDLETLEHYRIHNLYWDDIKTSYLERINNLQKNSDVIFMLEFLARIDKEAAIQICWDKINQTSGVERQTFFYDLLSMDPENEIQYTKQILLLEQDEYYRHKYFPDIIMINFGLRSTKFLSLEWVSFLEDFKNQEGSEIILNMIDSFRENFYPQEPDSSATILEMIDHLINMTDSVFIHGWIGDMIYKDELLNYVHNARTKLQRTDSLGCGEEIGLYKNSVYQVYKDSLNPDPRFVNVEGLNFLYWNAQYILDRMPEPPANPNLVVKLKNSLGNQIPASNVKYYEGSWKDAVNNGDGTFTVITTRPTVSIRVFYEYASQQVDNVTAQNNTYTFTTVNAAVQLINSLGNFIDQGTVQYYAGAWRSLGTTSNGVAYKELLPINYSFRMTYEYSSIDKRQDLSSDPTVVFQTVNAAVQLKNSLGNLIDAGTVQYYAGAWRTFGTTSNGIAYKELLPVNYSFRMTYEFVSNDKQQNISTNPVVDFNTVLCSVKVSKTSDNQPINNADVKYYSGAWRNLGTTNSDGITTKELLPANISFRATSGTVSLDKQQDISVNSLVEILLNVP